MDIPDLHPGCYLSLWENVSLPVSCALLMRSCNLKGIYTYKLCGLNTDGINVHVMSTSLITHTRNICYSPNLQEISCPAAKQKKRKSKADFEASEQAVFAAYC